jgi:hypothetical protein
MAYDKNLELIEPLLQELQHFLVLTPWWPSQESDWAKIHFPKGVGLGVHTSSGYKTCLLTAAMLSHRLATGKPKITFY